MNEHILEKVADKLRAVSGLLLDSANCDPRRFEGEEALRGLAALIDTAIEDLKTIKCREKA